MKITLNMLLTFLLLSACNKNTEKTEIIENSSESAIILNEKQAKIAVIETSSLQFKNISTTLKVNGKIDVPPQNLVSVSVPLGGYLVSTDLLEGMFVKKGQIIAKIEGQQYIQLQQDFLTAKNQFELTEKEYTRQKDLNLTKISSDKIVEQAKSAFQMQRILVKSFEEKLKLVGINPMNLDVDKISKSIQIYSPISGFVSKVNVNIGKNVEPADVLFELINTSDIHLALTIFEKDINQLAIGQKLMAYSNINPEKKYLCEIILIGKNFHDNKSVEVHCHFLNYDKTLLPGMYMNAEISLKNNNAETTPSESVVNFENKDYVFVETQKNQYEMQEVKTGKSENDYIEIKNAADFKNKKIVTKGAYTLLMKAKNIED